MTKINYNYNGPLKVGIGGPVGSGKTTLLIELCREFKKNFEICAITNDIYTKEDAKILSRSGVLSNSRIMGVETGGCPHTAIRDDTSMNAVAIEQLQTRHPDAKLVLLESGGDNLASTFSLDLVDWWMFVIDVAQGDDIPRKKGPGIIQSDLLVINKVDLALHVGVDASSIHEDAQKVRGERPVISCQCRNLKNDVGIKKIANEIHEKVLFTKDVPPL